MFDFNTNEGYFLHLLKCGLKTEKPEEPPVGIDFEAIFELAKKQDVENIVFLSIDQLENNIDSNLYSIWQEAYYKRMKYLAFQDMALEELIEVFTKAGIDCMPLKGSVIKNYYPSPDLRCMGDIDFLVREQNRQVVRDIMHSLGYEDDLLDDGQVDSFRRSKLEYIEVHYDFSAKNHVMHKVFTIDWDKLVPNGTPHLFKQTFEDLYFFNMGHYVKNMHNKGMGLRGIVDTFVLWNRLSDDEQVSLINRFEEIGINDFNSKLVKISDIWFNDAKDDGSLNNLQEYLVNKKTYKYIKNADIFVCSSHKEGYSTAVTEALILGVPIISTNVSGAIELINNGCGCVVSRFNPEQDLYDEIKRAIVDGISLKEYKKQAILRGEQISPERSIEACTNLFDKLVKEK